MFFLLYSLQDTQDETAVLWLDEIQDGIHKANKDTEESQRCKYYHSIAINPHYQPNTSYLRKS